LYVPESSNKFDAERCIREAIVIIQNDPALASDAKRKIISHLENSIISLQKGDTADFFGIVKETIIILGALGSIAGGYCAILQAQEKLNDATNILEKSCINQNYLLMGYRPNCFTHMPLLSSSSDIEK
jgi:hypothetical protein